MGEWLIENAERDGELVKALILMNVAAAGNSIFLDKLLNANFDPNVCDSRGRTPLVFNLFIVSFIFIPQTFVLRIVCTKS